MDFSALTDADTQTHREQKKNGKQVRGINWMNRALLSAFGPLLTLSLKI